MKRSISLVPPIYNEKEGLKEFVSLIVNFTKKIKKYKFNIIISDSHSIDGSSLIAKALSKKYRNVHYINTGPGIGTGIYEGHMYASKKFKPEIMMQMDADGQVDKKIIIKLIKAIEDGYGFAFGSRFVKGGKNNLSFERKVFTLGSSWFCRIFIGPFTVHEFTNSARAFSYKTFKKIKWNRLPLRKKTFIFLPALLHEAILTGDSYKEVPLIFNDRSYGCSKNKIVRYTIDLIVYGFKVRIDKVGIWLLTLVQVQKT